MESRGNAPGYTGGGGSNCFGSTLHYGPFYPQDGYEETTSQYCSDIDLSLDFHTYGLVWTETEMYVFLLYLCYFTFSFYIKKKKNTHTLI